MGIDFTKYLGLDPQHREPQFESRKDRRAFRKRQRAMRDYQAPSGEVIRVHKDLLQTLEQGRGTDPSQVRFAISNNNAPINPDNITGIFWADQQYNLFAVQAIHGRPGKRLPDVRGHYSDMNFYNSGIRWLETSGYHYNRVVIDHLRGQGIVAETSMGWGGPRIPGGPQAIDTNDPTYGWHESGGGDFVENASPEEVIFGLFIENANYDDFLASMGLDPRDLPNTKDTIDLMRMYLKEIGVKVPDLPIGNHEVAEAGNQADLTKLYTVAKRQHDEERENFLSMARAVHTQTGDDEVLALLEDPALQDNSTTDTDGVAVRLAMKPEPPLADSEALQRHPELAKAYDAYADAWRDYEGSSVYRDLKKDVQRETRNSGFLGLFPDRFIERWMGAVFNVTKEERPHDVFHHDFDPTHAYHGEAVVDELNGLRYPEYDPEELKTLITTDVIWSEEDRTWLAIPRDLGIESAEGVRPVVDLGRNGVDGILDPANVDKMFSLFFREVRPEVYVARVYFPQRVGFDPVERSYTLVYDASVRTGNGLQSPMRYWVVDGTDSRNFTYYHDAKSDGQIAMQELARRWTLKQADGPVLIRDRNHHPWHESGRPLQRKGAPIVLGDTLSAPGVSRASLTGHRHSGSMRLLDDRTPYMLGSQNPFGRPLLPKGSGDIVSVSARSLTDFMVGYVETVTYDDQGQVVTSYHEIDPFEQVMAAIPTSAAIEADVGMAALAHLRSRDYYAQGVEEKVGKFFKRRRRKETRHETVGGDVLQANRNVVSGAIDDLEVYISNLRKDIDDPLLNAANTPEVVRHLEIAQAHYDTLLLDYAEWEERFLRVEEETRNLPPSQQLERYERLALECDDLYMNSIHIHRFLFRNDLAQPKIMRNAARTARAANTHAREMIKADQMPFNSAIEDALVGSPWTYANRIDIHQPHEVEDPVVRVAQNPVPWLQDSAGITDADEDDLSEAPKVVATAP